MINYLYVHVPFCKSICFYCDFCHKVYNDTLADKWLVELEKEINSKNINPHLKTIYIGGGTPSCLPIDKLERLLKLLEPFSKYVEEYTVEINPETIDIEKIKLLKRHSINRVSIGVESFNDNLLKMMNRKHSKQMVLDAISLIRNEGIDNISCDLMYSLPSQTIESFKEDIQILIDLKIPHISFYSLTIEENTVFKKKGYEPLDSDLEADMYEEGRNILINNNYLQYEISNYCLKGYESIHNKAYWLYEDFYGLGLGASSKENHSRFDHTKSFEEYLNGKYIKEEIKLSKEDEIFESIMMNSRLMEGIDIERINKKYGIDLLNYYGNVLKDNKNLIIKDGHLYFNRDILNTILVDFMK